MTKPDPIPHEPADAWLDALLRIDADTQLPDQGFTEAVLKALPALRRAAVSRPLPARTASVLALLGACMAGIALALFIWTLPSAAAWLQTLSATPSAAVFSQALEHLLPSLVPLGLLCWWSLSLAGSDANGGF